MTGRPRICVVVPAYNAGPWVRDNLCSIAQQSDPDFDLVFIDDASTDDTWAQAKATIATLPTKGEVVMLRNPENRGAMANIHRAVHDYAAPGSIIVTVDGDDWLMHLRVLEQVRAAYEAGAWMTIGTFTRSDGVPNTAGPLLRPDLWDGDARDKPWRFSHLRTFYRELFCAIDDADLQDPSGEFWRVTWDMAMMFPMAEMAGPERVKAIERPVYVYNCDNPISDDKIRRDAQQAAEQAIRAAPRYARRSELPIPNPRARTGTD